MKRVLFLVLPMFVAGTSWAEVPLFAAKCPTGITADSNTKGQVYVNGKIAKLIKRPDGQVTARSGPIYVDITPQGNEPPIVSYTGKARANGMCEVVSFKAPAGKAASTASANQSANTSGREPSAVRAGRGEFDSRSSVPCAQSPSQPMTQCPAAIARDPGIAGTVIVTHPDGRTRAIFFEKGKAQGADLSQADGSMHFKAQKIGDLYKIEAGRERYEIAEALLTGG